MNRIVGCVFLFLLCCLGSLQAENSVPRVEKIFDKDLKIVHFLPGGFRGGIYDKGEKIRFSLVLNSRKDCTVHVKIDMQDFYRRKYPSITFRTSLKAGKNTTVEIPVKDPGRYGHYTLSGEFRINGKLAAVSQSAFAVIAPPPAKADVWFEVDGRNAHFDNDNTALFKRLGAGSFGLNTARWIRDVRKHSGPYKAYFTKGSAARLERIVGYISLGKSPADKEAEILRKKGVFPYSPKAYEAYDQVVRECAVLGKDTIKLWCLVQEVDAAMSFSDSPITVMADHVYRVKRFSRILREVNPKCKIAVMNSCGDDYFYRDFSYVRMLLKETAKYVDYFAIDAYSGTWNGVLSPLEEPEKGSKFKKLLLASSKLAQEFGLPSRIIQAERGYFVPYTAAFDSPIVRDLANFNARSIIIARGMPFIMYYSRHGACRWYTPGELAADKKRNPHKVLDGGFVRSVFDAGRKVAFQPRPSAAAYATLARELAFVTDPCEVQITRDIYSYHFKRPDGKRIAAVWTTSSDTEAVFRLPAGTVHCELTGEKTTLKGGEHSITISQSPCFLILNTDKKDLTALLKKAVFPHIKTFAAFVRCTGEGQYALSLQSLTNQDLLLSIRTSGDLQCVNTYRLKSGEKTVLSLRGKGGTVSLNAGSSILQLNVPAEEVYGVPFGKTPRKIVTLKYPDHVRPLEALRAERNLFKGDGSDIRADFAASWDMENLYLHFTVRDRIHLQRQSGSRIWRDDCIQVGIDALNNALPKSMGREPSYDGDDHVFGFALLKNGPFTYAWYHGKLNTGAFSANVQIRRKGNETVYHCSIPWKNLPGIKVRKGTVFGFTFLVMDNNDAALRSAPCRLEWTGGIAGGADPSRFRQLILQ